MKKITFLFFTIIFSAAVAFGQGLSGVTGVVTDQDGARSPGIKVTLTDTKTARELTTVTNSSGVYAFNNIQPGSGYRLTFESQGFKTLVLADIQLGVGKIESHNAQMAVGEVTESVEVVSTSGDATLNTTDASVGNVIGRRQLRELPIQLRQSPAALIGLQPGAIGQNVAAGGGNRTGSVTGARVDQGNITVDGIDANDQATGQAFNTIANAPIDSIQEFRAVTAGPNANEGRSSGGQIQLTTNSGTNNFHGSLREYWRHETFAANTFFNNRNNVSRPVLRRHQFGGSLGGPLPYPNFGANDGGMFKDGKNRLFFFFDFEGRRDRSGQSTSRAVPLPHVLNGQIGYILAASTTTGDPCPATARIDTRPDCVGFATPAQIAGFDPLGTGVNGSLLSFVASRYPQPNDLAGGNGLNTGLVRWNAPIKRDDRIYTARIDATPSTNHRIFGRMTVTRRDSTNAIQYFPNDPDSVGFKDESYGLAFGHTWIINEKWTNIITVGTSVSNYYFPPPDAASFPQSYAIGAIGSPYPSMSYQDRNVFTPTYRDDVTYTAGSHTLQFGGSFKPIRQNSTLINDFNFVTIGGPALNPTLRPANIRAGSTGGYDTMFSFMLGRINGVSTNFNYAPGGAALAPGTGKARTYAYNEYEFYAQDNWRVRNDLTFNMGLRYHLYPAPWERNGFQADQTTDFETLMALRVANAAAGISGVDAEPLLAYSLSGKENDGVDFYKTGKTNFSPRFGFAYNPSFSGGVLGALFGERKTVLRGNYSMVYDRVGGGITFIQNQVDYLFNNSATTQFTNVNVITALSTAPRFSSVNTIPAPAQPSPPTITTPFYPFVTNGEVTGLATGELNYTIDKNFRIPYSHTFTLGFQRELPGNMLIDVSYVGRKGRKLFTQTDTAQVLNFKDNASGQFLFDALNTIQPIVAANVAAGQAPTTGITAQAWLENQMNPMSLATYGVPCSGLGLGANCTQLLVNFVTDLVRVGGAADITSVLYSNGLLAPNVGMSAQFGGNLFISNQGKSDYHGLLVSLQRRFSNGLEFDVNYTLSHSKDNNSSQVNTVTGGSICDFTNLDACYGYSDFDIRHLFNTNFIWEVPFGRGRSIGSNMNKWADAVVGGWTLAGILSARSGLAIDSTSGSYSVRYYVATPSIMVGNKSAFKSNIREEGGGIQYFADPIAANAALRYPKHGEIGTRNIFRSPMYWGLDLGLSKKFKMPWSESHMLTIRADAFNVTNTNHFSVPVLTINSTTFGRITSSLSSPREVQFAIRYDF